jgi:adenosine 3'-phospho 5'-phosphosulfate transporter B2
LLFNLVNGLILLILFLAFDASTSNFQERMSKRYEIDFIHTMLSVNVFSTILSLTSLVYQAKLVNTLSSVVAIPRLTFDILLLSFCSAAGNFPIYLIVTRFGVVPIRSDSNACSDPKEEE